MTPQSIQNLVSSPLSRTAAIASAVVDIERRAVRNAGSRRTFVLAVTFYAVMLSSAFAQPFGVSPEDARTLQRLRVTAELHAILLRPDVDDLTLGGLARLLAVLGDLDRAKSFITTRKVISALDRRAIALALLQRGRVDEALALVDPNDHEWLVLTGLSSPAAGLETPHENALVDALSSDAERKRAQLAIACRKLLAFDKLRSATSEEELYSEFAQAYERAQSVGVGHRLVPFVTACIARRSEPAALKDILLTTMDRHGSSIVRRGVQITCETMKPEAVFAAIDLLDSGDTRRDATVAAIEWMLAKATDTGSVTEAITAVERYGLESHFRDAYARLCLESGVSAAALVARFELAEDKAFASAYAGQFLALAGDYGGAKTMVDMAMEILQDADSGIALDLRCQCAKHLAAVYNIGLRTSEMKRLIAQLVQDVDSARNPIYPDNTFIQASALSSLLVATSRLELESDTSLLLKRIKSATTVRNSLFMIGTFDDKDELVASLVRIMGIRDAMELLVGPTAVNPAYASGALGTHLARARFPLSKALNLLPGGWSFTRHGILTSAYLEAAISMYHLEVLDVLRIEEAVAE